MGSGILPTALPSNINGYVSCEGDSCCAGSERPTTLITQSVSKNGRIVVVVAPMERKFEIVDRVRYKLAKETDRGFVKAKNAE